MEAAVLESLTNTTVATRSVEVVLTAPCPKTDDPILDSRALRDSLNSELIKSAAAAKEFAGYIVKDNATGAYSLIPEDPFHNTNCASYMPPYQDTPTFPGKTVVALYHTHMWPNGMKFGPQWNDKDPETVADRGPSFEDKENTRTIFKRPEYISDYDAMHRVNRDGTSHPSCSKRITRNRFGLSMAGATTMRTASIETDHTRSWRSRYSMGRCGRPLLRIPTTAPRAASNRQNGRGRAERGHAE